MFVCLHVECGGGSTAIPRVLELDPQGHAYHGAHRPLDMIGTHPWQMAKELQMQPPTAPAN